MNIIQVNTELRSQVTIKNIKKYKHVMILDGVSGCRDLDYSSMAGHTAYALHIPAHTVGTLQQVVTAATHLSVFLQIIYVMKGIIFSDKKNEHTQTQTHAHTIFNFWNWFYCNCSIFFFYHTVWVYIVVRRQILSKAPASFRNVINDHMRIFIVVLQSLSYFSISHKLFALSQAPVLWSAICFAFARFSPFVCYVPQIFASQQSIVCCAAVQPMGVHLYLYILAHFYHSMQPSLCSIAQERCIS